MGAEGGGQWFLKQRMGIVLMAESKNNGSHPR